MKGEEYPNMSDSRSTHLVSQDLSVRGNRLPDGNGRRTVLSVDGKQHVLRSQPTVQKFKYENSLQPVAAVGGRSPSVKSETHDPCLRDNDRNLSSLDVWDYDNNVDTMYSSDFIDDSSRDNSSNEPISRPTRRSFKVETTKGQQPASQILDTGMAIMPSSENSRTETRASSSGNQAGNNSALAVPIFKLDEVVELPSCIGVVVMDGYYVILYKNKLEKKHVGNPENLKRIGVTDGHAICSIHTTSDVAVLQMSTFITVVSTDDSLCEKYSIQINRPYPTLCCLSFSNNANCPIFGTVLSLAGAPAGQEIHLVSAKSHPHQRAGRVGSSIEVLKVYETRDISAICGLPKKKFVAACAGGVKCFCYSTGMVELVWSITTRRSVTDVCSVRESELGQSVSRNKGGICVLACVQDEHRVMKIRNGDTIAENVLPESWNIKPTQISVRGSRFAVREFNQSVWRNFIHEF